MGDSEFIRKEEGNSRVEPISLSQIFEELCPIYMSYGMTYDEYWYGDCFMAKFIRQTYQLKEKHKDEQCWLQGVYIYEALCDVSPILHAFSKSGTKPLPYRNKPLMRELAQEISEEEKEKIAENERLKAQVQFDAWMKATAKHFENK